MTTSPGSTRRLVIVGGLVAGAAAGLAAVAALLVLVTGHSPREARAQTYPGYTVVNTYPHDPEAFTEGLAFRKGRLFEGTGLDHSSLRRVQLPTGEVMRQRVLADRYFGEGVTLIGTEVFQLTYQEHTAWAYDARTFDRKRRFTYDTEGWGLTDHDGELVMSDGTDVIRFRDPKTFEVTGEIHVSDDGTAVSGLNELEWVEGEIYANVWPGDDVVRIDPGTGEVTGRFNLTPLHEQEHAANCGSDVTNGIAYMRSEQRLFVTGKYWCHVYEIVLSDQPQPTPSPAG